MKIYQLKSVLPAWHFDPATFGQLKVLRFFGIDVSKPLTKGVCSGIIGRLFSDPANKHLWTAYVYTTGDEEHISTDLLPHDRTALAGVRIPDDWHPKPAALSATARKAQEQMAARARQAQERIAAEILKDGSPFDDPLPDIAIADTTFCFTGEFEFGTRNECHTAVTNRAGSFTDGITRKTQVLVIGNDPNPNWSHGSYGNKIVEAMFLRLRYGKLNIIPELYWCELLKESTGNV